MKLESYKQVKKRPDTTNVCQGLQKKHGLDKSVSELHLKYLLATGKLETVKKRGGETLKIPDDVSHLDANGVNVSGTEVDTNGVNVSGPQPEAELSKEDTGSQEERRGDTHLVRALGILQFHFRKQMTSCKWREVLRESLWRKIYL